MNRLIVISFLAAIPLTHSVFAQGAPLVTKFEVAGIPVIFKPVRANDVVAVRLYLRGGSSSLTPANAGIENLMLAASTHGTAKYDKDAFANLSTETGTNIGSQTAFDYSVLTLQGVRQHWNEAWDLFTQAALKPTFPTAEVEIVRGQQLDAVKRRTDDPDSYLAYLADSLLYAGHPYAAIPTGTVASLTAITRDALAAWHGQRMTKENLLIVVVGNVSREDLTSKIQAAFGGLPAKGGAAASISALGAVIPELISVERKLPTNYIMGYFAAPSLSHPDYLAFRAATDMLADNLFEEVRTKRNMTYAVSAGLDNRQANRGLVYVTAVEPDTTMKVIFSTIRNLQTEPIPPERVVENINPNITAYLMRQETNMGQASALGLWELVGGGWQNLGRFVNDYRSVTAADIQRVAKQYMRHGRFVVIGDPSKLTRSLVLSF